MFCDEMSELFVPAARRFTGRIQIIVGFTIFSPVPLRFVAARIGEGDRGREAFFEFFHAQY